jgi:hypothetical protein
VGDNLNFGSQVLLNDIYRRYVVKNASPRHYLIAGRLLIFVVLALALLVVYKVTFLFDVAIFMVGLSASEMSANWAQWWWWRFNGWGRVAASFGGGVCYLAMRLIWPAMPWWYRMCAAIVISTLLWIVVTFMTAPESQQFLARFYQRARPLGAWGPISGAPSQWGVIVKGIAIALTGAAAVMAYIVGITHLYVGRYWDGTGMLALAAGLGVAFWRSFDPFVRNLALAGEDQPVQVVATFGISRMIAMAGFATAAVFALNALLFLKGHTTVTQWTSAALCTLAGVWLWRKHW